MYTYYCCNYCTHCIGFGPPGYCIGFPFTSEERFPVLPPFGISELAGWTTDKSKMPQSLYTGQLQGGAWHAISRHFSVEPVLPRSLYLSMKGKGKWLYLTAPDSTTAEVSGVPIMGTRILVGHCTVIMYYVVCDIVHSVGTSVGSCGNPDLCQT